jgi:SM-20-related protein
MQQLYGAANRDSRAAAAQRRVAVAPSGARQNCHTTRHDRAPACKRANEGDQPVIDLDALANAPVQQQPFQYFAANNVLQDQDLEAINADFPNIDKPGLFPLTSLRYGPAFARLIAEIGSRPLAAMMGEKFAVNLLDLPLLVTVRGQAQAKDGRIHTDTKDKVVTCLLYLNDKWDDSGGRLRLLRTPHDLEDYVAEIPPHGGVLTAFKVAKNSWHGHKPFVGQRRYVMFNWVQSDAALSRQLGRHTLSAKVKSLVTYLNKGV